MSLLPASVTPIMPMWFESGLFFFFFFFLLGKLSHDAIRLLWGLSPSTLPFLIYPLAPFVTLANMWVRPGVMNWFHVRAGALAEQGNSLVWFFTFPYVLQTHTHTHTHIYRWDGEWVGRCKKLSGWGRTTAAASVFPLKTKTQIKCPSWLYRNNQSAESLIIVNYSSISQLAGTPLWSLEGYQSQH